ncbi:MAG: asparaginase [Oscillospiraceae bacterium]|jgi:L-asparaginase|nr:asparaginase [Oscillospiraceae bacterium]
MKRILWLQTGGTVNCRKTNSGLAPGTKAGIAVNVSGINCETEAIFTLDSSDITPHHWQMLAKRILEAGANYDGFVITHGTDTLEYSAAALSLMLGNIEKPVIFTGAILPPHEEDSDAAGNLTAAFEAARDLKSGVFIAFAGKIMNGISCVKLHSKDKNAFFDTDLSGRLAGSDACVAPLCEKVFVLKITPNSSSDIVDFILEKGYKGVICEGFGLGGIPCGLLERLGELVISGVRVVIVSQCLCGGADLSIYAAHRKVRDLGLEAWSMTAAAALARLMLELGPRDC